MNTVRYYRNSLKARKNREITERRCTGRSRLCPDITVTEFSWERHCSFCMVTEEHVLSILHECYDPEIPLDVVNLGLVYGITIREHWVCVTMTLTNRWCPAASWIGQNIRTRLLAIPEVHEADVRLVWEPEWNPLMMSQDARTRYHWPTRTPLKESPRRAGSGK